MQNAPTTGRKTHTHTHRHAKSEVKGRGGGGTEKNMKLVAKVEIRRWGGGRSQQLETATKWAVGVGAAVNTVK